MENIKKADKNLYLYLKHRIFKEIVMDFFAYIILIT